MDRDFYLTRKVDAPVPTRWYQFTLRRILGATTWAAVWCGVLVFLRSEELANSPPANLLVFSLLALFALSPFLAVGTLVGHPYWALLVGIVVSILGVGAMFLYGLIFHFSPC